MFTTHTLKSDALSATFIPALGGKLTSLRHLRTGFELIYKPKAPYRTPHLGASFTEYDASGFDDAFPCIDAEAGVQTPCGPVDYPDHGEVWSAPMRAERIENALHLSFSSAILPYHYEKTAVLRDESLLLCYHITNIGSAPFPAIWTAHGLMNIEPGMRLLLPSGVDRVQNLFLSPIGPVGELPFPGGAAFPLDRPLGLDQPTAFKYYALGPVHRGECGAEYPQSGMRFTMRYDADVLPYFGVWMTEGGYRGDHNFALEPSTGFYDGISMARRNGALPTIAPGEALTFQLEIALSAMK